MLYPKIFTIILNDLDTKEINEKIEEIYEDGHELMLPIMVDKDSPSFDVTFIPRKSENYKLPKVVICYQYEVADKIEKMYDAGYELAWPVETISNKLHGGLALIVFVPAD